MQLFIWTPETFVSFNSRSLAEMRKQRKNGGAISGEVQPQQRGLGWGKGRGARELPAGTLGWCWGDSRRRLHRSRRPTAVRTRLGSAPAALGCGFLVEEHQWGPGKVVARLTWAMQVGGGRSAASSSSPAAMARADREWRGIRATRPGALIYRSRSLQGEAKEPVGRSIWARATRRRGGVAVRCHWRHGAWRDAGGACRVRTQPGRSGFGDPVGVRVDWPGVRRVGRPGGVCAGVRRRRGRGAGRSRGRR